MQIDSLASSALYQMNQTSGKVNGVDTPTATGVAMLSKQLDATKTSGAQMVQAMEQSVNPSVGGNVDFYA